MVRSFVCASEGSGDNSVENKMDLLATVVVGDVVGDTRVVVVMPTSV